MKGILIIVFCSLTVFGWCQKDDKRTPEFAFNFEGDTLEGIYIGDYSRKKPLVLFIQGSDINPLYMEDSLGRRSSFMPRSLIHEDFNLVILSKPGIPLIVNKKHLDSNYNYQFINSKSRELYFSLNTLGAQEIMYSAFISFLNKQYKHSELIVIGHSQGARVASELIANTKVDKLVYMSADPLGRIANVMDAEYAKHAQADTSKINYYNNFFDPKQADSLQGSETFNSWRSFSKPTIPAIVNTQKPVLVVYGTFDDKCPNCYVLNYLPSFYKHISVLDYQGYGHNYEDTDNNYHWDKVMSDVFNWLKM